MSIIVQIFGFLGIAIVVIFMSLVWAVEMLDKVETLKEKAPWLGALVSHNKWHGVVLLACWILLTVNGYELLTKEIPEVPSPPQLTFSVPPAPALTIVRVNPPMAEQCWVNSMTVPPPRFNPAVVSASETFVFCNVPKRSPVMAVIDYDKNPDALGRLQFPDGKTMDGGYYLQGKQALIRFQTSIPSFQSFMVPAYSWTERAPRALKVKVTAIDH